ncbi:MAG: S1 family peptidase, partial [Planctomycetaceae bacterium]
STMARSSDGSVSQIKFNRSCYAYLASRPMPCEPSNEGAECEYLEGANELTAKRRDGTEVQITGFYELSRGGDLIALSADYKGRDCPSLVLASDDQPGTKIPSPVKGSPLINRKNEVVGIVEYSKVEPVQQMHLLLDGVSATSLVHGLDQMPLGPASVSQPSSPVGPSTNGPPRTAQAVSATLQPPTERADLKPLLKSVDQAVVKLMSGQRFVGSGFYIAPGKVATNFHVASGNERLSAIKHDGTRSLVAGFYELAEEHDLAILAMHKSDQAPKPLSLAKRPAERGDSVGNVGAPAGLSWSFSEGVVAAVRPGREMNLKGEAGGSPETRWIQYTATGAPGSSGSPVFNDSGEVVAVCARGHDKAKDANFAVAVSHLAELLKRAENRNKVAPLADIPLGWRTGRNPNDEGLATRDYWNAIVAMRRASFDKRGPEPKNWTPEVTLRWARNCRDEWKELVDHLVELDPAGVHPSVVASGERELEIARRSKVAWERRVDALKAKNAQAHATTGKEIDALLDKNMPGWVKQKRDLLDWLRKEWPDLRFEPR